MKVCPYCAQEIQDAAVICRHCGAVLGEAPSVPPSPESLPGPMAPASRPALQYSHSGTRYLLGYGTDFFGIWDRSGTDSPVAAYPRTDDGWRAAWSDFTSREQTFVEVGLGPSGRYDAVDVERPKPAINPWWWALPILIGWIGGIIAYVALRDRDRRIARNMLATGLILSAVTIVLEVLYYSSTG